MAAVAAVRMPVGPLIEGVVGVLLVVLLLVCTHIVRVAIPVHVMGLLLVVVVVSMMVLDVTVVLSELVKSWLINSDGSEGSRDRCRGRDGGGRRGCHMCRDIIEVEEVEYTAR
jgi:hypothetical protein